MCLGDWQEGAWSLRALEALCTLDAARFRLPLAAAVAAWACWLRVYGCCAAGLRVRGQCMSFLRLAGLGSGTCVCHGHRWRLLGNSGQPVLQPCIHAGHFETV